MDKMLLNVLYLITLGIIIAIVAWKDKCKKDKLKKRDEQNTKLNDVHHSFDAALEDRRRQKQNTF